MSSTPTYDESIDPPPQRAAPKPDLRGLAALLPKPVVTAHGTMSAFNPEHPTHIPLGVYKDNQPPTAANLKRAHHFFHQPARHLFSTHQFHLFPKDSTAPEVLILGQSNAGKSTLLNALCGASPQQLASESKKAGHTRCMHVYGVGNLVGKRSRRPRKAGMSLQLMGKATRDDDSSLLKTVYHITGEGIVIIDTPGYGPASQQEWGKEIMRLLRLRKQLRRVLILVDWSRGLTADDMAVMRLCHEANAPFQLVLTKVEQCLWHKGRYGSTHKKQGKQEWNPAAEVARVPLLQAHDARFRAEIAQFMKDAGLRRSMQRLPVDDTLWTAAKQRVDGVGRLGVDQVRWAIMQACGLDTKAKDGVLEGIAILEDDKGEEKAADKSVVRIVTSQKAVPGKLPAHQATIRQVKTQAYSVIRKNKGWTPEMIKNARAHIGMAGGTTVAEWSNAVAVQHHEHKSLGEERRKRR